MLETLDYTIRIGSTPTFLYFDYNFYMLTDLLYCLHYRQVAVVGVSATVIHKTRRWNLNHEPLDTDDVLCFSIRVNYSAKVIVSHIQQQQLLLPQHL